MKQLQSSITRKFTFDAGHRVHGHEGKCRSVHGHTYHVEVTCTAAKLDKLGMIIDFGVIKSICGQWLEDNLDHGMIIWNEDPLAKIWKGGLLDQNKYYIMRTNPTAENIAELLFEIFKSKLSNHNVRVTQVVVHETPNCFASYPR